MHSRYRTVLLLLSPNSFCSPTTQQANKLETECWGKEQWLYLGSQQTEKMNWCLRKPVYSSQNSGLFYTKRMKGVGGGCKFLGVSILFSCSCPHRSCHDVPINLQQDKCYCLFCKFLSLYDWTNHYTFKFQSLKGWLLVYFRLWAILFLNLI